MKFYHLLAILFVFNYGFSQSETYLSKEAYEELQVLAKTSIYVNMDSCFYYVNKIEQSKNPIHKAFANGTKGYLYQLENDSIKSKEALQKSYLYLNKVSQSKEKLQLKAYLLNCEGLSNSDRYNLKIALDKFQQGKKIAEEIGDLVQVLKFNSNIASINIDIGNYNAAISIHQESANFLIKNPDLFPKKEYEFLLANTFVSISNCYQSKYELVEKEAKLIDSAVIYSEKALEKIANNSVLRVKTLSNLGNIQFLKKNYDKASKAYLEALAISKKNAITTQNLLLTYNLGYLNFEIGQYKKSLFYFKKVDSIWNANKNKKITNEYLSSNYYQTKIYKYLKDDTNFLKHSKIYLQNVDQFETFESKLLEETLDVNNNLKNKNLKKEILQLNEKYRTNSLIEKVIYLSSIFTILILLFLLIKKRKEKEKNKIKSANLIQEYKINIENKKKLNQKIEKENTNKETKKISIDDEKENEIVDLLEKLESKNKFLNHDFTQEYVAKKIKTNTTYLSFVVNKRFGKSFNDYITDLKINYALNEMITNETYRKLSLQKIADSVGYKSTTSFRKSFIKKTGIPPTEFLKNLN